MRWYVSGTKSCAWRWSDVVLRGARYLLRLHLVKLAWGDPEQGGALMLHWIEKPDPQPDPHDHPVPFLSIVLRGGYVEEREAARPTRRSVGRWPNGRWFEVRRVRWLNLIRSRDVHRIISVEPGTLTLCIAGPKRREWGFHTVSGWVAWRPYSQAFNEGAIG